MVLVSHTTPSGAELDDWTLCWEVNLRFHARMWWSLVCYVCGKTQTSGNYHSTFLRDATSCRRGHSWKDWAKVGSCICNICDKDNVLNITKREKKCFVDGCESFLNVSMKVVEGKIDDEDILGKYQELWKRHQFFTCLICQCEEPLEDAPSRSPTLKCKHDPNICSECMTGFLSNAIDTGGWQEIRCPDSKCDEALTGGDVQAFAPREAFLRYEELITMKYLSKLPNFRWCAGDEQQCGSGQILPGGKDPKWKCRRCKAYNCFNCKTLYHEKQTCQQYQRFKKVDGKSLETILQTTKGCPRRGCTKRVEKHKRCKDTFCEKKGGGCGTEFCWHCKVIYSPGNRSHLADCIFAWGQPRPKPSADDPLYADDWDKDPEYIAPDDLYAN